MKVSSHFSKPIRLIILSACRLLLFSPKPPESYGQKRRKATAQKSGIIPSTIVNLIYQSEIPVSSSLLH
jgi:hypothetical protein